MANLICINSSSPLEPLMGDHEKMSLAKERGTHKASGTTTVSTVNGQPSYFGNISSMTLYPSELITVSTGMYTKHYYNGSQRLASRIGGGFAPHPDLNHYDPLTDQVELPNSGDYHHKALALVELWTRQAECAGLQPSLEFSYSLAEGNLHNPLPEPADGERYFYHSDHLGSSAFITTENGYATQFLAYLPFGETLNEEQNSSNYYSPFKFSAKEKDVETGYSYFGARYYSPELSVWLSVDPMADERPWLSPYNYCQWNPIMLVDPTGMIDILIEDFSGGAETNENGDPPAKAASQSNVGAGPRGLPSTQPSAPASQDNTVFIPQRGSSIKKDHHIDIRQGVSESAEIASIMGLILENKNLDGVGTGLSVVSLILNLKAEDYQAAAVDALGLVYGNQVMIASLLYETSQSQIVQERVLAQTIEHKIYCWKMYKLTGSNTWEKQLNQAILLERALTAQLLMRR